jgi:hypothetical protein
MNMISRKSILLSGTLLMIVALSACNMGATPPPTEDPGAIQTQAFNVVLTQVALNQTQTAQALPPTALPTNTAQPTATIGSIPTISIFGTNTPFAFNTQQPGLTPLALPTTAPTIGAYSTLTTQNGCNNGIMISESAPFDGATIKIGKEFNKSWTLLNTGTCDWDEGYTFSFRPEWSTSPEGASIGYFGKDEVIPKNGEFTKPGQQRTFTVNLKSPNKLGEYVWSWRLKDDAGNLFGSLVFIKFTAVEQ